MVKLLPKSECRFYLDEMILRTFEVELYKRSAYKDSRHLGHLLSQTDQSSKYSLRTESSQFCYNNSFTNPIVSVWEFW